MKIVLCDDDNSFLKDLSGQIEIKCKKLDIDFTINLITNLHMKINNETIMDNEVFFLDIDMPEISGFDIASYIQQMNSKALIVFVSNRDDLVFQALSYHPFFFIRKKYLCQELETQLTEINKVINPKHISHKISDGKNDYVINVDEVEYVESYRNYIFLHIKEREIKIRLQINKIEKEWKKFGFIRVHNGYLVNYRFIKKVTAKNIILKNLTELSITRGKMNEIKLAIVEAIINEC